MTIHERAVAGFDQFRQTIAPDMQDTVLSCIIHLMELTAKDAYERAAQIADTSFELEHNPKYTGDAIRHLTVHPGVGS